MLNAAQQNAEIRLPGVNYSLFGTVRASQGSELLIELLTAPVAAPLKQNASVQVFLHQHGETATASARICAVESNTVRLQCLRRTAAPERRRWRRLRAETEVAFRTLRTNGLVGPWCHGTTRDISAGGLCLLAQDCLEVPHRIEMIFALPSEDDAHNLREPIRATGQTCRIAVEADGRLALGIEFVGITACHRDRLKRFTGDD